MLKKKSAGEKDTKAASFLLCLVDDTNDVFLLMFSSFPFVLPA